MIEISRFRLKVPQMDPRRARRLARRIVELASEGLPGGVDDAQIEALELQIDWSDGLSVEQMARRVARRIIDELS